ncbi:MAG: ATP-binding protein [Syntrophotaleaceae bacterium]
MENAINLLLVEDSEVDALLVLQELEDAGLRMEALRVTEESELAQALKDREWSIVLGDYSLPGFSGMAALAMVHAHDPHLPFIMVSGVRGEEFAVEAMRAGAGDFITKDNLSRLAPAIRRELASREERRARRKAEEERERSERRFRHLADSMPQLVWTADAEGRVDYYNRKREDFVGFSRNAEGHWFWTPVLHPQDLKPTLKAWSQAVEKGSAYQVAHRIKCTDGSFRWHLSRATPVRDQQGRVVKWYGTATDIHDLKQVEAERERLLAELDATFYSMPNAVLTYDARGRIRRMNPAAEQLLHYTGEMKDWPMLKRKATLRPETPDGQPYPLKNHPAFRALNGETTMSEVLVYHPAGFAQPLWVAVSASPILTAQGIILGAVSTVTDITPLHELQREREIYVHTISHDLRTPLTVIHGYAQLLEAHCRDPESRMHVEAILKGVDNMAKMIENLVEAARLEGGKIVLDRIPVRVDRFLPEMLRQNSSALDISRIFVDVPEDLPLVNADPARLERILINLITNALKYSPDESPVDLFARSSEREIVISVRDRGYGIDPEDLPHIFERFHRSRNGQSAGSVGLGLYITRSLVEAHGGRIWVDSRREVGSTFSFTLPTASDNSHERPSL